MTRNSEVDATSSRQADQAPHAPDHEPRSGSETYLAALWSEIIGIKRVMLSHRFLDVGGNSLTLNIIVNRIEKETGASLDPQLFFADDRSSLFELAKELDVLLEGKPAPSR
jgi:hypothetical protein